MFTYRASFCIWEYLLNISYKTLFVVIYSHLSFRNNLMPNEITLVEYLNAHGNSNEIELVKHTCVCVCVYNETQCFHKIDYKITLKVVVREAQKQEFKSSSHIVSPLWQKGEMIAGAGFLSCSSSVLDSSTLSVTDRTYRMSSHFKSSGLKSPSQTYPENLHPGDYKILSIWIQIGY